MKTKKAKRKVYAPQPVPNTFKQMLDLTDRFLAAHTKDGHGKKLWDVLSALRGPDQEDASSAKSAKTVPIRRAAFPLVTEVGRGQIPAHFGYREHTFTVADNIHASAHFNNHAENAARALKLIK